MNHARRLLLAGVLALALTAASAAPALAQADTAAVAINTKDGSSLFKFAFQVRRTMHDVVDATNAAVAYSSCEACTTTAISFQVLLVTGDPSTVTPTNVALAYNLDCSSCTTAAFAYQFVLDEGGPIHFTADGNRRIAALRRSLHELRREQLTPAGLQARLDAAAAELRDALSTEVVSVGAPPGARDRAAPGEPGAPPSPSPEASASPEPRASPSATATPSASPGATATPSPTPASAPSASPTATEPAPGSAP